MDIDQLAGQFKTLKELQQYCNSQFEVIGQLTKKIVILEEDNKKLLELLDKNVPRLEVQEGSLEIYKDLPDELVACIVQIKLLKNKAVDVELTFEEAKKLDIYTKLLITLKNGQKKEENPAKAADESKLVEILKGLTDEQ